MAVVQIPGVTAPTVTGRVGELLDTATVHEGITWIDKTAVFPSYNCMVTTGQTQEPCPRPTIVPKAFTEGTPWVSGSAVTVYGAVVCAPVGMSVAEQQSELIRVFAANESVGVEKALMAFLSGPTVLTDLTPAGGAVSLPYGLGILEGHAAANYAGQPTIHVPRTIGSMLFTAGALEREGEKFFTKQRAKVASGGGYEYPNLSPAGAAPAAGDYWLYATGEVWLGRGEATPRQTIDWTQNDVYALVERPYVIAVDCYTSAVRVKAA